MCVFVKNTHLNAMHTHRNREHFGIFLLDSDGRAATDNLKEGHRLHMKPNLLCLPHLGGGNKSGQGPRVHACLIDDQKQASVWLARSSPYSGESHIGNSPLLLGGGTVDLEVQKCLCLGRVLKNALPYSKKISFARLLEKYILKNHLWV